MNCKGWSGRVMLKHESEIERPNIRFIFLDDGGTAGATLGGYTCWHDRWVWWDPPPIRHGDGTTFAFADQHVEYWKWKDPRTIEFGLLMQANSPPQQDNPDIPKTQMAAWGICVQ
jgi:prepilin-type processing-associated H-X9-DG protein